MSLTPKTPAELAQLAREGLRARRARQRLKANIKAGRIGVTELLDVGRNGAGDPIIGRMRIGQLLDAVPGWGPVTVTQLLEDLELDANTHVDKLSQDDRDLILLRLPER